MIKLLRRVVLLGTAGAAGWMLWSRRQASLETGSRSNTSGAASGGGTPKWTPIPADDLGTPSASSSKAGAASSATSRAQAGKTTPSHSSNGTGQTNPVASQALIGEADALVGQADALAGEADARVAAQAAEQDAAAADARADAANAETLKFASEVTSVADKIDWTNKWVPPNSDGSCPASHPVKGNDGSKIYHVPGGTSYRRTKAERCYADPAAAEADGYRPSKR